MIPTSLRMGCTFLSCFWQVMPPSQKCHQDVKCCKTVRRKISEAASSETLFLKFQWRTQKAARSKCAYQGGCQQVKTLRLRRLVNRWKWKGHLQRSTEGSILDPTIFLMDCSTAEQVDVFTSSRNSSRPDLIPKIVWVNVDLPEPTHNSCVLYARE